MLKINPIKAEPVKHTKQVDILGTAIIAFKCRDGILMATNPIARRGNNLRYKNLKRFSRIAPNLVLGSSGDYSDFQKVTQILEKEWHKLSVYGDAKEANPSQFGSYLANEMYKKRTKVDPLYMEAILAGVKGEEKYLACCDLYGNYYENQYLLTGFAHYCLPAIVESEFNPEMTMAQTKQLVLKCFKVIYAKYKLSYDQVLLNYISKDGVREEKERIEVNFSFNGFLNKEELF